MFNDCRARDKKNAKAAFKLVKKLPNGDVWPVKNAVGDTREQVEGMIAFYKDLQPENEFFVKEV